MLKGLEWFNLFCDMDGVLTDFDRMFTEHTGLNFAEVEEEKGAAGAWELVKGIENFWLKLEPKPDMYELWQFIQPYRPILLTSPGRHDTARAMLQKREWVNRFFGYSQPLIYASAQKKSHYARGNAILIDDWMPTIQRWTKAGGVAIHHSDSKNTIEKLSEYLEAKPTGDVFDHL